MGTYPLGDWPGHRNLPWVGLVEESPFLAVLIRENGASYDWPVEPALHDSRQVRQ